jgi:hypothetical protein
MTECTAYVVTKNDWLFRRVREWEVTRRADGSWRANSMAFMRHKRPDAAASVYIEALTTVEEARSHRVEDPTNNPYGVARFSASCPIDNKLIVEHKPEPDACGHAEIYGITGDGMCRRLAHATTVVYVPPDLADTGLDD